MAMTTSIRHAVVWIDHHEAKVFHLDSENPEPSTLNAPKAHVLRHPKHGETSHPADAQHFFHDVARALADADEILVVGPATAKLELIKHVHKHDHMLVPRIVGVETVDHPTDGQLAAYARKYFRAADRVR